MYGVGGSQGGATHLLSIDTTSGQITDLGTSVNNLDGLTPVPEPSAYAMIFGIGLAGFAIIRRRFSSKESLVS